MRAGAKKIANFLPKSHPLIAFFFFSSCMMQKTNERNGQQWSSPPLCLLSEPSLSASLLRKVLGCQPLLGPAVLLDQIRCACWVPLFFWNKTKNFRQEPNKVSLFSSIHPHETPVASRPAETWGGTEAGDKGEPRQSSWEPGWAHPAPGCFPIKIHQE